MLLLLVFFSRNRLGHFQTRTHKTQMQTVRSKKKKKGFDGGQRQWFRMEIVDQQTGILIANLSSTQPAFAVSGLDSERLLQIAVMAVNSKGVSDRVILEALTLKAPQKIMGKSLTKNSLIR